MGLTLGPMQGLSMSNPVLAGPLTPSILNVILKHVYRIMKDLLRVLPLKLKLLVTVGLALGIFAILLVMNLDQT